MLLQAKLDPASLDTLIMYYKLEMEREDAALVERTLGITDQTPAKQ